MSTLTFFLQSWLLGGLSYPALTFVVSAAVKSTAVVLLAASLTLLARRQSALLRLWIWRCCMLVLASLLLWALAPQVLERWRMTVRVSPAPEFYSTYQQAQEMNLIAKEEPRAPRAASPAGMMVPSAPLSVYASTAELQVPLAAMRVPWLARVEAVVLRAWWGVALVLFGLRLVRALCGHVWLRRQAQGGLAAPQGMACRLRLVRGITSPVVTGWRRAQVWLPEEAADWPAAKLRAVCLHEAAHHQRRDAAWQWLGWAMTSVWWWNPLGWMALRQMTAEAELSADEAALAGNITAPDYAQVLVEIASGRESCTTAAGVPMLGRGGIQHRVQAILSGTGCGGLFGTKARLALAALALLGVVAVGVEARHPLQDEQARRPMTEEEKGLVEQMLNALKQQERRLKVVHFKMRQSWVETGKETVRSPRPSEMEAWVDHAGRKARREDRPRVTRWLSGAAPWYIENSTSATDGKQGWSQRKNDAVEISREPSHKFFAPWNGGRAEELTQTLQQMKQAGSLRAGTEPQIVRPLSGTNLVRMEMTVGRYRRVWEVDLAAGGLSAYRSALVDAPPGSDAAWEVQQWGDLPDGTHYPSRWTSRDQSSGTQTVYDNEITFLETLTAIPAALLVPPAVVESPYVAKDGSTAHAEELKVRFIHSRDGKPVPQVKVHFEINDGKRTEIKGDAAGVARIPLPEGEVKYLRLWGMKPGFVMQMVQWRRYGDPLKLPAVYDTRLYPDGGPIGGQVVNEQGEPVAGAKVSVNHRGGPTSWDIFTDVHDHGKPRTETDADGRWALKQGYAEDLTGMTIHVEHPRYKRLAMSYETASGQPLSSLRDGSSRLVVKSAGIELKGTVADTAGRPVRDCAVTLGRDRWGSKDEPEARTDAEGRFTVYVHEAGPVDLTFEAAGLQPQLIQTRMTAGQPAGPMAVILEPGATVRVRVVDEAGKPVAKALLVADRWRNMRNLWYEARTDAEGRLVWTGAPADEILWTLLSDTQILRDLPVRPTEAEQTLVLRPATRFKGTVVDAQTGKPVPTFKVTVGDSRRSKGDIYWEESDGKTFQNGAFTMETEYLRFDHALRIEAEGYAPLETVMVPAKLQDEVLALKLTPKAQ